MKTGKFWFFVILGFVLTFVSVGLIVNVSILMYIDPASLIVVLIPVVFYSFGLHSGKELKDIFSLPCNGDKADKARLNRALSYYRNSGSVVLLSSLAGSMMGIIAMMSNLEDSASVGANLAVALISVLYGAFLNILVIIPCRMMLRKKLDSLES